ncbi:hypothetical protein DFH08DRAFT_822045 [Mycena albidolilacea]|uniref:Uncharacterized protein n=1 Tax=Mycena albidolilacea TaxID=1033008 RepID=A0AAD6Z9Q4_9AGAR|nr:hypothetical protein DFH08DRAFT_822045 [Mycena albidolilacea]
MVSAFISFVLLVALGHTIGAASLLSSPTRNLGDVMANSARDTPALPSGLPYAIVPPSGGRQDPGSGVSLITLLLDATLSWDFVVNSPTTAAQIFAVMPPSIANATGTSADAITPYGLEVYMPASYTVDQLQTLYLAYIPSDKVDALQLQIVDSRSSNFYQNLYAALGAHVISTLPIDSVSIGVVALWTTSGARLN